MVSLSTQLTDSQGHGPRRKFPTLTSLGAPLRPNDLLVLISGHIAPVVVWPSGSIQVRQANHIPTVEDECRDDRLIECRYVPYQGARKPT
ncbi:hypothetical protein K443DRAFT_307733 [Laccaria amethystina LaAM-08-1]|uniref:Uncharacterized protein n=1 Tax=Laccaria amethystina LaAM-08-1 TaxID=1095629 RepID=A0A0C9XLX2_9AGAR|nr:hypothetical protein K443DRAFT_307733 [Laccaria amethystina LaAM-08-1]